MCTVSGNFSFSFLSTQVDMDEELSARIDALPQYQREREHHDTYTIMPSKDAGPREFILSHDEAYDTTR